MLATFSRGCLHGFLFQPTGGGEEVLIIPKTRQIPDGHVRIVQATLDAATDAADLSDGLWLRHPSLGGRAGATDHEREIQQVLESWAGAFSYVREDPARSIAGLRDPQIGAVHAVHAHWSVSGTPATIVMPTGGVETTEESLTAWFKAGVVAVGIGSNLISKGLVAARDFAGISAKVKQVSEWICKARSAKWRRESANSLERSNEGGQVPDWESWGAVQRKDIS